MQIRLINPSGDDYAACVAISQPVQPENVLTEEFMRTSDREMQSGHNFQRVVGEIDGVIVAHGQFWQSNDDPDDSPMFNFHVRADLQDGPIPTQMQSFLIEQVLQFKAPTITSEPLDSELYRMHLLESAGFQLGMRFLRSDLDVEKVNTSHHQELYDRLTQSGIGFCTLVDMMARDPEWRRNVWRLFTIIDQDVPYPDPQKSVPFEVYSKYYEGENFEPASWTFAIDTTKDGAEQYVGMSVVNRMASRPDAVFAGITGVVPAYRRRRIATALKMHTTRFTREIGRRYIETDNEENNPMYMLNIKLGFEPLPAMMYYKRESVV